MYDKFSSIIIDDFRGYYNRGENESIPKGYALDSRNNEFVDRGIRTRFGAQLYFTKSNIVRIHFVNDRFFILTSSGGTGNIFDSTTIGTSILALTGMTDFKIIFANNRYYISPMENIYGGLPIASSGFIYIYDGVPANGTRKAGGVKPTSGPSAATSATAGVVETGQRLFAVAYETNTGFITPPNATWTLYTGPGGKKVDLTSIPTTAVAAVTKVHILVTKKIIGYSGNQLDYQLFFLTSVAEGTTSVTVDFFDSSLVASADYLLSILEEVPAGSDLTAYRGRLIVSGAHLIGGEDNSTTGLPLVSVAGNYEQFSSLNGFCIIDPADISSLGVKKAISYRGTLYFHKLNRTYATQDSGAEPTTWIVIQVDAAHGCGSYGTARVLDSEGNSDDIYLIAGRSGLYVYNGSFNSRPLSYNIQELWENINIEGRSQLVINPQTKSIYITINNAAGDGVIDRVLYGDYSDGLSWDKIRWDIWEFANIPRSITLFKGADRYALAYSADSNIYCLYDQTQDDEGAAITNYYETYLANFEKDGSMNHFSALRIRAKTLVGSQSLSMWTRTLDGSLVSIPSITIAVTPAKDYLAKINVLSERASFKFQYSSTVNVGFLRRLTIYGYPYSDARPQ